jgi:hypothetical protein
MLEEQRVVAAIRYAIPGYERDVGDFNIRRRFGFLRRLLGELNDDRIGLLGNLVTFSLQIVSMTARVCTFVSVRMVPPRKDVRETIGESDLTSNRNSGSLFLKGKHEPRVTIAGTFAVLPLY